MDPEMKQPDGIGNGGLAGEADPYRGMAFGCPKCGYDLVGAAPSGVCSECGTAFDKAELLKLRQAMVRFQPLLGILTASMIVGVSGLLVALVSLGPTRQLVVGVAIGAILYGPVCATLMLVGVARRATFARIISAAGGLTPTPQMLEQDSKLKWLVIAHGILGLIYGLGFGACFLV